MTPDQRRQIDLASDVVTQVHESMYGEKRLAAVREQIRKGDAQRNSNGTSENLLIKIANEGHRAHVINLIDRAIGEAKE